MVCLVFVCIRWVGSFSYGQRNQKARYHLVLSKVMDRLRKSIEINRSLTVFKWVYIYIYIHVFFYPDANLFFEFQACQTFDDINLCQFSRMIGDDWDDWGCPRKGKLLLYRSSQVWSSCGLPLLTATVAWRRHMEDDFNCVVLGKACFFLKLVSGRY